jgi:hypothetical protein
MAKVEEQGKWQMAKGKWQKLKSKAKGKSQNVQQ